MLVRRTVVGAVRTVPSVMVTLAVLVRVATAVLVTSTELVWVLVWVLATMVEVTVTMDRGMVKQPQALDRSEGA